MADTWQAAAARHRFSALLDQAVEGTPQFIRRRDGREVVLVSKEYFEKTKPTLKSYLLTAGYARDEEDAFDLAMKSVREGAPLFGTVRTDDRAD
jgi:prevent-host-death family protein